MAMLAAARRAGPVVVGLLLLLLLVVARSWVPAPFDRLRLAAFDDLQRLSPRQRSGTPVAVVDIDDESLRRYGQWPWSRERIADLVRAIDQQGAAVIGLDMVFAEPDRTSPARLVAAWEKDFGFRRANPTAALPDNDAILAKAFAGSHVVTGFGLVHEANGLVPSSLVDIATIGGDPLRSIARYEGAIPNLAALEAAAAGHGSFTVSGGTDEIIRRLPLIMGMGDRIVPSLALETLRVLEDEDTIRVRAEHWHGVLSGYTVRVGDVDLALDATGNFWLHHPKGASTPALPAWKLLAGVDPKTSGLALKGAAVLVGTSAVGLGDLRPTPMSTFEPGVNIHASAIEQALQGRRLIRPIWAPMAESAVALLLALALLGFLAAGWARAAALTAIGGSLAAVAACVQVFVKPGLLFDPTFPALTVGVVFVATSLLRYAANDRAAQRLRTAFMHYLAPDLVTALARHPERLKLGGESRDMTFLFTDLEGFTSLTEQAEAEALVSLLNAYLDNLCRIAMDHGGTVDKMVGDAMHVMFNAPLDQPDHAARAVRCALALDAFAQDFATGQQQAGVPFGATRIGVNTGRAVVGNFGGSRRFDYTAHGDAINTAARLESANKTLGTRICVSRATREQAPDHLFRPVGTLMLKGKSIGVEVFEPLTEAATATAARYDAAFARLGLGDETAGLELVRLHDEQPNDPVLRLYARRVRAGDYSVRIAA